MKRTWIALGLCLSVVAAGCGGGGGKAEIQEDRLTVGKVQGEIKVGMAASQVAELLGSPNIVTTDEKRREVWIFDKISNPSVTRPKTVWSPSRCVVGRKVRKNCEPPVSLPAWAMLSDP